MLFKNYLAGITLATAGRVPGTKKNKYQGAVARYYMRLGLLDAVREPFAKMDLSTLAARLLLLANFFWWRLLRLGGPAMPQIIHSVCFNTK